LDSYYGAPEMETPNVKSISSSFLAQVQGKRRALAAQSSRGQDIMPRQSAGETPE